MKFFVLAGLFVWLCIVIVSVSEGDLLSAIAAAFGVVCWIGFFKAVE